ncbi:MAG: hypothetical protein OXP66_05815 [Candidatus Tectomicrobia bacterium]|nr:hypothetical protein [Candidatus Tectomicrobia bacterium]
MSKSAYEEVAEVLPARDTDGTYFWERFAERIRHRFDGVPGTDDTGSFADECLRAGAEAVPVMRRNTLWIKGAPDSANTRARRIYELRIRLGLFYAASLRFLVQGVSRLRVRCGDAEWHGLTEEGQPFSEFAAGKEDRIEVTWTNSAPDFGKACLAIHVFLRAEEALLLTPELAEEVYEHAGPDGPRGLFGMMLAAEGQADRLEVDVAGVFLEALAQCVDRGIVRVNTRASGHVFVTPEFWLLTTPIGLDCVKDHLRTRRGERRYDFSRERIFEALQAGGHLVEKEGSESGNAAWVCRLDVIGWDRPLDLKGLLVRSASLPAQPNTVPPFDGTVNLRKETFGGSDDQ